MRKILMLAAMLIAPALAAPPAEAGDRGHGFRHHPPPLFTQPHFGHRGKVSVGRHFGHRPLHPRHFGHYRPFQPRFFGHHRPFQPRHFGGSGGVVVFKFHGGNHGFRHVIPPPRPHFRRHFDRPPAFAFARPPQAHPWRFSRADHKGWRGRSHRHR